MNEKLVREIDQLAVYQPGIDLMEEDLVAHEKNSGEHILDHRIATHASLVDGV